MCLIAWNWQPANQSLLLLANRDEFYARPALPLHWWADGTVLAGRDLQGGGTWLGLGGSGRLAALTNYRLPEVAPGDKPSRGHLVADFLRGDLDAASYLASVHSRAANYQPFNLLVFDGRQFMGLQSRQGMPFHVPEGIGGVSNADFNTPWPKLQKLKARLQQGGPMTPDATQAWLTMLQDRTPAADADLPRTGVSLELERLLSSCWIQSTAYGTRASSVVLLQAQQASFFEQRYGAQGALGATHQIFTLASPAGPLEAGRLRST